MFEMASNVKRVDRERKSSDQICKVHLSPVSQKGVPKVGISARKRVQNLIKTIPVVSMATIRVCIERFHKTTIVKVNFTAHLAFCPAPSPRASYHSLRDT